MIKIQEKKNEMKNSRFVTCYKDDIRFIHFSVHVTHELISQVEFHAVTEVMHVNNNLILKQNEMLKSSPIFSGLKFQAVTLYEAQACCCYSTQVSFAGMKICFWGEGGG
jgi:hypothetical protein